MAKVNDMLNRASEFAIKRDERSFWLGAVAERSDGAIVRSRNGSADMISPELHAEFRLSKKLDYGSIVYVARVRRDTMEWANSRPCRSCRQRMQSRGVKRVYYTIGPDEYGVIDFSEFKEDSKSNKSGKRLSRFDKGRWKRGES